MSTPWCCSTKNLKFDNSLLRMLSHADRYRDYMRVHGQQAARNCLCYRSTLRLCTHMIFPLKRGSNRLKLQAPQTRTYRKRCLEVIQESQRPSPHNSISYSRDEPPFVWYYLVFRRYSSPCFPNSPFSFGSRNTSQRTIISSRCTYSMIASPPQKVHSAHIA